MENTIISLRIQSSISRQTSAP